MEVFIFGWWWRSHQSLAHTKVHVFSDSVLCLGKMNENPKSNIAWEERLTWFKSSPEYRALDRIDGEPMEFEWIIFPGFTTLELCTKVQELLSRLSVTPEKIHRTDYLHVDVQRHLMGSKDNKKECESSAQFVSTWIRKEVVLFSGDSPQGEWDRIAEQMMLTFAESTHPVFRSTSPLSRGVLKSIRGGKLSIHYCADPGTIETVFRTILANQFSIYGPVAEMCEECDSCHDRTGRLVVEGQSNPLFVPSVMKTHIPLTDDPAQPEEVLLQRYQERIEKLSQQDRVSKICTDAGFLTTVEVGQYFMTKDTEEFSQFTDSVACRECTLPRDESLSEPKRLDSREHQDWTRIGSYNLLLTRYTWSGNQNQVYEQGPFSLVGQNFSWLEQVGHKLDKTTTSRKPQKCSSKTCR